MGLWIGTVTTHSYTEEAMEFFSEMAQRYGHHPNVIFELFNEPTNLDWSSDVKPYHEAVLGSIRKHSDNLVILGSPTWSQDVDVACADRVYDVNAAYTLHFYAGSHGQALRDKATAAMSDGCALFFDGVGHLRCSRQWHVGFRRGQALDK